MNTVQTWQIDSTNSNVTEKIGEHLGKQLRGNEVIELVSDLGGGKTTFVRGLAKGIGSRDRVTSPTFKISNVYSSDRLTLHHFDFYRLGEAGLMSYELHDVLDDPKAVAVIEWGDVVKRVLPSEHLTITFSYTGEDSRHLTFAYPKSLSYLRTDVNTHHPDR